MKSVQLVSALTLQFALAACGKPLGTYQVQDVRLVPGEAFKRLEPYAEADPQMLRVEFTSDTDLYDASDGGGSGLYLFTSFCPFQDKKPVSVSGSYYNDQPRYDAATHAKRHPARDPKSGKYVYTTYLRLRGEASENHGDGRLNSTGYDLTARQADLCLRIEHPGYFITPSQSRTFTVPAGMIRIALSSGSSK